MRAQVAVVKPPAFNRFPHSFQHIFSGGYAAAPAYGGYANPDEPRTLFVTGFPPDVKERELNNLLRFLPGYEVCCNHTMLCHLRTRVNKLCQLLRVVACRRRSCTSRAWN